MEKSPKDIDSLIANLFGHQHSLETYAGHEAHMSEQKLPPINVSVSEGMLLHVLTRAIAAKRVLEIGTLGGYSGTWIATALPDDGKLISLEIDQHHADVANKNFANAGVQSKVEVRVGPGIETLRSMVAAGEAKFDIVFIDADKDGYCDYLEEALKLTRKGGLILADNTIPHGPIDINSDAPTMRYNRAAAAKNNLVSALSTVMRNDVDGLTISVVL